LALRSSTRALPSPAASTRAAVAALLAAGQDGGDAMERGDGHEERDATADQGEMVR